MSCLPGPARSGSVRAGRSVVVFTFDSQKLKIKCLISHRRMRLYQMMLIRWVSGFPFHLSLLGNEIPVQHGNGNAVRLFFSWHNTRHFLLVNNQIKHLYETFFTKKEYHSLNFFSRSLIIITTDCRTATLWCLDIYVRTVSCFATRLYSDLLSSPIAYGSRTRSEAIT